MKPHSVISAVLITLGSIVYADVSTHADESGTESRQDTTQYLIELSEYEVDNAIPIGLAEAEVIDLICSSDAKPVETLRLTAMAETESLVQFGRRITVTTASMTQGNTTSRQTKDIEIGTILRLRIKPYAKGAIADINYSTKRLDGVGTDDSPPDILDNTMQSTQVYALGKPRLLSTVGSAKVTGVVVTVREIQ